MEKVKLSDLGTIITGNTPNKKNNEFYNSKDICFFKPGDITEDTIENLTSSEEHISEKARSKARILPKGTILVTCIGTIGKVGIINHEAACNQQINAIIANDKVDAKYLAYLIYRKKIFLQKKANAPVVPIINKKDFSNIEVNICNKEQQIKIVTKLDKIQEIIDIRKKQIEELDKLIESQFVEMFENEKNEEILNNVCEFINGDRGKNYPSAGEFVDSGIPFINAGLINDKKVNWKKMNYITEEKYNKLGSGKIQKDDVLYCLRGSLGKHCIIDLERKGAIASSLVILRANKEKILPEYLLNILDTDEIIRQQEQANNGSSQPNLSAGSVKKYKIKLPNIQRQEEFVNIVKQIDKQKFEIQKSLEEMQKLQESLMNKYFGG